MTAIHVSEEERISGKLTQEHFDHAVKAVREDGYVILENAVEREHAGMLCMKMIEDTQSILAREDVPFNFNRANIQQDPPPFPPFLLKDVLMNDLAISVSRAFLGDGMKNILYSGNTALPNTNDRQPVHADVGQLWPGLETATPPFGLVINILPMDVSPQNGSTEIWPGTHNDTTIYYQSGDLKVPAERLEARRKIAPPIQPTAPAGSIVIRDIRMWHAGMPNHTSTPRPMIALIYYVAWWNESSSLEFPRGTETFFDHPHLHTVARFVDGEINYLKRHQSFDLQK